jgi:hypothetical protein
MSNHRVLLSPLCFSFSGQAPHPLRGLRFLLLNNNLPSFLGQALTSPTDCEAVGGGVPSFQLSSEPSHIPCGLRGRGEGCTLLRPVSYRQGSVTGP